MKNKICIYFRRFKIIVCMAFNWLSFKWNGVVCQGNFPRTRGIIQIDVYHPKSIIIGKNVIINSGRHWNMVGFGIQTSLKTIEDGIIRISSNVGLSNVAIVSRKEIIIEENVLLGSGVVIYDNDFHAIDYEDRVKNGDRNIASKPVKICEGAFIGAGSIILKGVTIGRHSVVGAKSLVSNSIPDGELWAGNPARFVRKIN